MAVRQPYTQHAYPQPSTQQPVRTTRQNSKKKKSSVRTKSRGKLFLCIITLFAAGFLLVSRHNMVHQTGRELQNARAELHAIESQNQHLQRQIDRSIDLMALEALATEEFGMRRIERHQMFFIDMNTTNFGERISQNRDRVPIEEGILHGVPGILIMALETLR